MSEGIVSVKARQVLDSRSNPTIEATVSTAGLFASGIVPSGASTGIHEALELRDHGKEFSGKGVKKAVENVNKKIAPKIIGMDSIQQKELDKILIELDATENKTSLGANAILSVSMAVCRLGAKVQGKHLFEHIAELSENKKFSLPVPQLNVLNGGKHAGMENDIQEHMVLPTGAKDFSQAMQFGAEFYLELKKTLKKKFGPSAILLGDEGGFVPPLKSVEERLELMQLVAEALGLEEEFSFALDCASSEFFKGGTYTVGEKKFSGAEIIDYYKELSERFRIVSIEDGLAEDDWENWTALNKELGKKVQIVGDDLLVTNIKRIKRAVEEKSCNALLLKINQIGTITESIEAAKLAFEHGWKVVVSHRSGETEDSFIADLVVGLGANQSKFGAPARSERNAKYNQLLRIEEFLKEKGNAPFAGF